MIINNKFINEFLIYNIKLRNTIVIYSYYKYLIYRHKSMIKIKYRNLLYSFDINFLFNKNYDSHHVIVKFNLKK